MFSLANMCRIARTVPRLWKHRRAESFPDPIIEVGTLFGFTTQRIATWKSPAKDLVTIDTFSWNPLGMKPGIHRRFTEAILHYTQQHGNTRLFAGTNTDFYASYAGPTPAMLFIDAGHEYEDVMVDIQWGVSQKIPLICGHDYQEGWGGVKRAVDEVFGDDKQVGGSVWAHIRRD